MKAKYDNINIVATKAKEMVATKATDKVWLMKYSKSLTNGNLKSTQTTKQGTPPPRLLSPLI
jgi:hypothetical protein